MNQTLVTGAVSALPCDDFRTLRHGTRPENGPVLGVEREQNLVALWHLDRHEVQVEREVDPAAK